MNFTPSFSVPITTNGMQQMNQWPSPSKMTSNGSGANGNGGGGAAAGGQVVGILQAGENGINYLRTIDSQSLQAAATASAATAPTVITLPIQFPTDKPGDPPQTVQIQVLPQMSALAHHHHQQHQQQQNQLQHNPKYQMTQIPVQALNQNATLLWCTPHSQSSDGNTVQLQIADQHGLPENVTLVTALQSSDLQLIQTNGKSNSDNNGQIPISLIKAEATSPQHHTEDGQQNDDLHNSMDWSNNSGQQQQQQQQRQNRNQQSGIGNDNGGDDGDDADDDDNDDEIHDENLANDFISLQSFLKFNNTPSSIKQEIVQINENGSDSLQITEDNPEGTEMVTGGEQGEENDPKSKRKKKYKKKPPKPKKPKPGQVQIATAVDGTILFCCPECHMAYPDKEMLEQHLVMHKIERRFICDICGAGLKRKEHLERHKMGHSPERPFICNVCSKGFKRKEHLNLHVVIHSGQKTEICGDCGKGFYRKDHLRKHVRSHLMRRMKEDLNQQNNSNNSSGTSANSTTSTVTTAAFNGVSLLTTSSASSSSSSSSSSNLQQQQQQSQIHHVTIQMPSSQMQLPVQIQVPQHEIKVDSTLNDSNSLNNVSTVVLPTAEETNAMAMLSPSNITNSGGCAVVRSSHLLHSPQEHQQHTENLILERHIQQQHAKMNQAQQKDSQMMSIDQQQQYSNMHANINNNNNNSNNKNNNIQMKENYSSTE